ncbi:MAG: hypothetical protein JWP00_41 [Chloroflexi bacterium]|jgi:hypothetical protein|nr:hypothetical protein [Chloroflexota bacterium]
MVYKIFARVFGGIGAFFLLVSLIITISTTLFISQSLTAGGTVTDVIKPNNRSYIFVISFTPSIGQPVQFSTTASANPPAFQAGQQVRVYYNPSDPANSARVDSFTSLWFWTVLPGLLGLAFGGVGLGFFLTMNFKERKQKWLRLHGQPLTARVTAVRLNRGMKINGKSPYVVHAEGHGPQKDQAYSFKSDNIWPNPPALAAGDEITVLVDPANYRRYHVIIS